MGGQALGTRRLVIAEQANEGLCMRIEVPLETPLVRSRPRAVAAGESLLPLRFQEAGAAATVSVATMTATAAGTRAGHRLLHNAHVKGQYHTGAIVHFLLLKLGQRHVGCRSHCLDGLHNAHTARGGMSLGLQKGIVYVHARRVNGHISTAAGVMRTASRGPAARGTTASGDMSPGLVNVVLQLAVHAQEVLLDMIGSVELLEAGIALEGLLVLVDVFMSGVQIPPVRRVWTVRTGVTLLDVHSIRRSGGCSRLGGLLPTASSAGGAGAAATAVAGR